MRRIEPDRWRVLSRHLDDALELPGAERTAWLASIRLRDEALARELEAMLAEHDALHVSSFLDGTVLDARAALASSLAGQIVGAYRLLSFIGQGGSGSVWLAERCDGRFEGRAAVKLLNLALLGRAGEERFGREGTILARLRHPRIAHLIDAGVSQTAQPYLVLEHVDGEPIDRYCDTRGLGVEARVRLFLDVLEAVAFAHANLIVHRDIKPANVLVSRDGQVKLLDFGIAKLMESDGAMGTGSVSEKGPVAVSSPLTRDGGVVLTPEYAAPEQLGGGAVTTATDVYALGVLLYVLLTGRHPSGDAPQSPATLVRAIVEIEPARPSDAVVDASSAEDPPVERAGRRGTTPGRLRRALRGDLDVIVARALKKDAAERYGSVAALADDLRRYLHHEPIAARPDALWYRTARFVRRHAGAVAASAAVVVLVATFTIVHTTRLSAERDRARREAAKAIKVSELLIGLLANADPYAGRSPGEPTLRALLDAGAAQVRTELAGEPELQAELLTTLGRTYRRLGLSDKAQRVLEQALTIGEQAFGPGHERVGQTLDNLGVALADGGHYQRAGPTLERALAIRRTRLGAEHADVAVTLAELGRVYQDQGLNGRAEPLHREALAIRRKTLGDEHRETAVSLSDLASVLRLTGDLAGAEALLRQCLELNLKTRGEDHPNTATTRHDLALLAVMRGERREAEAQLRAVLAQQRATLGVRHPVLATTLNSLAHVLLADRRHDDAADVLMQALDIAREARGSDHQLVAIYSINLAAVHLARREPAAAEPLLREGLRIRALAPGIVPSRRRTLLEDDWSLGAARSLLGASLVGLGRLKEAEAVLLEARRDLEPARPPHRRDVQLALASLADAYAASGRPASASAPGTADGVPSKRVRR